jgi:prepilin-type processing-associated H-X9-DG protein
MGSTEEGGQTQLCPNCGSRVDTNGQEPFATVICSQCGTAVRVERVFEHYIIVEPLGSGGMGSVYKARDTRLNRFVAIKLLQKEFADKIDYSGQLQYEARITASINHPHVVKVFGLSRDHGQHYLVMELVKAGSLDDRMQNDTRISELQTLEIGLQVASGLQAAHEAGLIHRDVKPGNILFADGHTAKIVDFGLALLAEQKAETKGEIWGTPYYVAPERLSNEREDFRSDIYSLGATLFHAIAGRPTFEEQTQSAGELKKLKAKTVRLKAVAPDVSAETARIIKRMLQVKPADRYQSYDELIGQLRAAHTAVGRSKRRLLGKSGFFQKLFAPIAVAIFGDEKNAP